jgi:hypothetical protein
LARISRLAIAAALLVRWLYGLRRMKNWPLLR